MLKTREFDGENVLEEKSENFSSEMLSSSLFVVHDAAGGGHDDVAELTGGEEIVGPLLNVLDADVEPGRDDSALVQPSSLKKTFEVQFSLFSLRTFGFY